MNSFIKALFGFYLLACNVGAQDNAVIDTVDYFCSTDSSWQKALFYTPQTTTSSPLLVALHTWSGDYTQSSSVNYSAYCVEKGWTFIYPDFRGKNNNPDAAGSQKVVRDILDAVTYAQSVAAIDSSRIYLVGASGGGHAALQVVAKGKPIWAGVSVWAAVTDLVAWYSESREMENDYWQDIYDVCGGDPTKDSSAFNEAWQRSPLNFLSHVVATNIDINAGIHDGHDGYSVPVSHSLRAFNKLADAKDTLTQQEINFFVEQEQVPESLKAQTEADPLYGEKAVLFRRASNKARITIFDGIHEIIYNAALDWLAGQRLPTINSLENPAKKMSFNLQQNYPNPFNPTTNIEYTVRAYSNTPQQVNLSIYNLLGQKVVTLVNKEQPAGTYQVQWDAVGFVSSVYYYRIEVGDFQQVKKMLLVK